MYFEWRVGMIATHVQLAIIYYFSAWCVRGLSKGFRRSQFIIVLNLYLIENNIYSEKTCEEWTKFFVCARIWWMSAWRVNQTVNMPIDQQPNELSSHTESVHIGQSPSGDESKKTAANIPMNWTLLTEVKTMWINQINETIEVYGMESDWSLWNGTDR